MVVLGLLALPFVLAGWIISVLTTGGEWLVRYFLDRRERKRAAIEAELDRTQAELRATILSLSEQLNGSAHEARKALIRESFLARGEIPKD
ncbi:hypothetical protein [Microbacterium sp. T32]|uniref:hypothetical protein n=1 Tax=Microbacterium sp. T32 TaxID=1776083 RepID=UPI0007ABA613|nr:hypothetical protein [Microbacterium sp. T32]KZE43289.1 hypothetical protein AVW09_00675 [Microbacterium sp. T32]